MEHFTTLKNGKVLVVYSAIPYLGISSSDARVGEFLTIATEGRMTSYGDLYTGTIKDGNDVGYFLLCQYSAELIAKHLSVE